MAKKKEHKNMRLSKKFHEDLKILLRTDDFNNPYYVVKLTFRPINKVVLLKTDTIEQAEKLTVKINSETEIGKFIKKHASEYYNYVLENYQNLIIPARD